MKVYNPSREERAFLYQEVQDLEPLIKDLGSLTVIVEESTAKGKRGIQNRFRVTFMIAPETVGMRVQATNANLFEATIAAKAESQRQLNAIVNALPRARQTPANGVKIPPELLH